MWRVLVLTFVALRCICCSPECAAADTSRAATVKLYGWQYIPLSSWARAHDLSLRWDKNSGDVLLTNRYTRLALAVDSRRAKINGVHMWLSVPLTPYNQGLLIATIDVETLFKPILFAPPKNRPGQSFRVVALDPGHGGKDPGFEVNGKYEKHLVLSLAQEVGRFLQEAGLRVVSTRSKDTYVDLEDRPEIARRRKADLFVSLHYNAAAASGGDSVKGVEVYCLTPAGARSTNARGEIGSVKTVPGNVNNAKNAAFAYQMQKALVSGLDREDRGVRRARFAVLRTAAMPAVLIEGGFLTDPGEGKEILSAAGRTELARAIVDGILAYKRLVERE